MGGGELRARVDEWVDWGVQETKDDGGEREAVRPWRRNWKLRLHLAHDLAGRRDGGESRCSLCRWKVRLPAQAMCLPFNTASAFHGGHEKASAAWPAVTVTPSPFGRPSPSPSALICPRLPPPPPAANELIAIAVCSSPLYPFPPYPVHRSSKLALVDAEVDPAADT